MMAGVAGRCPGCGENELTPFFPLNRVLLHCCRLTNARSDALAEPRGDLELIHCRACGLVFNHRFAPEAMDYAQDYEESQGFSPTFARFAHGLAKGLIQRWQLKGKTALEIGCGKGEFLTMLCELGMAKGIGFDPAYVAARHESPAAERCQFFGENYGESHWSIAADFICCRHTLEHIGPVGEFVRMLRANIGDRTDTVVFFEVPDAGRILREGAFWDVYYEHASYFTAGSLARLFRRSGFEVAELWLDYDDQYAMITALPAAAPTEPVFHMEKDIERIAEGVAGFPTVAGGIMEYWRKQVRRAREAGRKVVLWGSGSKGVAFLEYLGVGEDIEFVVDINPYRHGKFMPGTGQEIVPPDFLKEYRPELVIVMNAVYEPEIRESLDKLGVDAAVASL